MTLRLWDLNSGMCECVASVGRGVESLVAVTRFGDVAIAGMALGEVVALRVRPERQMSHE